jgi:hypothetical protein
MDHSLQIKLNLEKEMNADNAFLPPGKVQINV